VTCPECGAQAEQLAYCDGCFVLCCYDCVPNVNADCQHPTDEWLVRFKVSNSISGKPLNQPKFVLRRTNIAPSGHMWRTVGAGF
jgi:hypothetical protein